MRDRVTLLLEGKSPSRHWASISASRNVVRVPNFAMLEAALDAGLHEHGIEVTTIVLDRSATAAQYLEFLSSLPADFRGDVVTMNEDCAGFLSAVIPSEGRVLYRLSEDDIEFYILARVNHTAPDSAWRRSREELPADSLCN